MDVLTLRVRRGLACLVFVPLLSGVAGCHSKTAATPENFTVGLNAHFVDHPECLLPQSPHFPYETSNAAETKQMNALAGAQLLTVEQEPSIHVSRYSPTTTGARFAPRFCFGHREVSGIDGFTPPAPANGFTETTVRYRYTLEDVPVWAKSEAVKAAFPVLAKALSGESTGTATLAGTMVGWQVPD